MRLNEVHVKQAGVLEDVCLADLPGLSVVHGGHGSGKTTLVQFLRDTLLDADSRRTHQTGDHPLGHVRVSDAHHRWALTRSRTASGSDATVVEHLDDPDWSRSFGPAFPAWISDQAVQEILSPGHVEADRFALLVRLCLETGGRAGSDAEIHRAEQAIAQAVREREGTLTEPGVTREISNLERRRESLLRDLQNLKQHDPSVAAEIQSIETRLAKLRAGKSELERECTRLRQQIADLEREIAEYQDQNRLPLDEQHLRDLMAQLSARKNRWREIRIAVEEHASDAPPSGTAALNRSSESVRATVSRLEQRMQERAADRGEHWDRSVEQETAALCRFVTQQQQAARFCEQAFEAQLSTEASRAIHRLETMLQDQIIAVQEELDRAENILDASLHRGPADCESGWHRDYRYENRTADASLESLQIRLRQLNDRLAAALGEASAIDAESDRLQSRLDELRRRQHAVPSLEEIDDLRARLAEAEARLELLVSHRDVLLRTERSLNEVLTRLRQRRRPAALEIASPWLERLTDGECTRVYADVEYSDLLIESKNSLKPLRLNELSRGTQQQLALVLRLALLQCHSASSGRVPLIIDDVFITSDDSRGSAAADLLRDVASEGQQIIILTCQNDVRALLAARGARIYSLSSTAEPAPVPPAPEEPDTSLIFKAFDGIAEECPGEMEDIVVAEEDDSHWLFYLEPEHSVGELSGLEISELNGITAVGLDSVEQFLQATVPELKERIQNAGFYITEERLKDLQAQTVMAVCVPMLRQRDAELLVAAGIDNVRQLARLRPEATFELVVRFQQSDAGVRFLRSGQTIDQQQAISWNRWALHARSVDRALAAAESRRARRSQPVGILSSSRQTRSPLRRRRERLRRSGSAQRRLVRNSTTDDSRRRREARSERRRLRTRGESPGAAEGALQESELKFYLSRSSDVEAAPSIGSTTAARLSRVGVETVDDLLSCDAQTVATLLDNRRITSTVIEQWKTQASLVCTIPKLRGHDAQILVACGQNNAEDISTLTPEELFSVVQPFCDTNEGARIVRGGKKPDIREVSDWIAWSRLSRPLRAA